MKCAEALGLTALKRSTKMKHHERKAYLWLATIQVCSLLMILGFVRYSVPDRIDSVRSLGVETGRRQILGDLVERKIVSNSDIPDELRSYPDKTSFLESDLNYSLSCMLLIYPAIFLQILFIGFAVFLALRGGSGSRHALEDIADSR